MNNASKPKYKLSKKTKARMAKVGTLSALAVTSVAVGTILSSCSGVSWKSTAQLLVSDNNSTLADQSFSESAYNGMKTFYENYCQVTGVPAANSSEVIEGNGLWKRPGIGDQARISSYENIKNDGSDIVVATGFTQGVALQKISSIDSKYASYKDNLKNTGFVFVDGAVQEKYEIIKMDKDGNPELDKDGKPIVLETINSDPTNISSISYRADEGSFLVGLSTAVYLNENWQLFSDGATTRPETLGVSGFVGQAIPSTISFLNGFRQGLIYWNSICSLIQVDDKDPNAKAIQMKWISPDNNNMDINLFVTSFSSGDGKVNTLCEKLINKSGGGAKVIIPVAGPQTEDVVKSVLRQKKNVSVIGVDVAQEKLSNLKFELPSQLPDKPVENIIPFSSVKKIESSVREVLNAIKTGKPSNGYEGFGYNNIANLNNNGVGISPDGQKYLIDPLFFTSGTGAITGNADATTGITTYDLSTTIKAGTKWKLSEIKKGDTDANFKAVYENFIKLLNSVKIKYTENGTAVSYKITGDELSKKAVYPEEAAGKELLPPITGKGTTYTIASAFGGTATTKVAKGTLLDGTKWHYGLQKI